MSHAETPDTLSPFSVIIPTLNGAEQLQELLDGITLEDGPARFESIAVAESKGTNRSYQVVVSEGRNRIIRRMFEAVGCRVSRLMRVRYGPVVLPRDLRLGKHRELSAKEVERLQSSIGVG